ncbi:HD domain-containing phosphohydrolase [Pseudoalteromonas denitrificans]|uniref:HD-GYP domain, c-di-GMP phosphodiesterase class II (Or its inactivated variant) n=1 Tax=Pseudoalteromonas denitrificans DSM 6059 TaxID=1123010 RepID=A0A1I1E7Z9_9GAMM|nr:HD domain-containing phosphohydrolase [Pseudoalteromonas denitrificans]SFB82782.1 HD-GYP domain, c-di-GMP phosphodiesterase class II (or its inactivated variant) [Pseudoalteromonas denitrificans DSM 6059]
MSELNNADALKQLLALSYRLSTEKNTTKLLEDILMSAKALTHADGGTIYSVTNNHALKFETLVNDSLKLHMGGTSDTPINFDCIPILIDGEANKDALVALAAANHETINIEDAYQVKEHNTSAARAMDQKTGYRTQSVLTVPLENHEGDINGVLQLINAQDKSKVVPFSQQKTDLVLSLSSLAAVALTNKQLITDMEILFQSLAKLIARAIDEKSPYTGGHCRRVPELTLMLADAVNNINLGPLADFTLNADEKHTLSVAGWLHDCGKIATPEYVMDKSTKLETVFDRIEFVDAKFEIVKKQFEIEELKFPEKKDAIKDKQQQLVEDRQFIKHINIGGEYLPQPDVERVAHIAKKYNIEMNGQLEPVLNETEMSYLQIQKGTLSDEERNIINHHIDITILLLESLPFPKHLQNVPEYAGGHHEKMDGTGYPRGLTKEQMSLPARMMAIADIFEALSAGDRPYKKAKKLSECIKIMGFMSLDKHIDNDLFNVFIHEKVYVEYANKFMTDTQIDAVDESNIPGFTSLI